MPRVNPVSAKTKLRNEVRRDLLEQWMAEAEDFVMGIVVCEIQWDRGCTGAATMGHEPLMRSRGGSILDRKNVLLTCWHCHRQVHLHVTEATARGFLVVPTKETSDGHEEQPCAE